MKQEEFFFCYTRNLKDYLKQHGFDYIITAKAISNGRQFWLFKRSTLLNELVTTYTQQKNLV